MDIQSTTKYDMFHRIVGNREINESLVVKIYKSIVDKNLVPLIRVTEDFGIIDGQHTLLAAKRAKVPVFYLTIKGADINDIISLNVNKRGWLLTDYIKSYAERGLGDYIILLGFMDKYDLSATTASHLLTNRDVARSAGRESVTAEVKSGVFKVRDMKRAERIANLMLHTTKYCSSTFWGSRDYVAALVRIIELELAEELIRKLPIWTEHTQKQLSRKGAYIDYLRQFEDVLNYMSRSEASLR